MTKKQKHLEKSTSDLIIVGPMPFPWKALNSYLKNPEAKLIFIDGGLIHWEKFKLKAPHLLKNAISAGDGDSSIKEMTMKKVAQDSSDLGFLLEKIGVQPPFCRYLFAGFLGGRLDHQLFNLGDIACFLKKFALTRSPVINLDDKIQFLAAGTHYLQIEGIFSLASLENNQIKIEGLAEYTSQKWLKLPTLSSRGLSNVGRGEIKISTKTPLMIIKNLF